MGDTENSQIPFSALRADLININSSSNSAKVSIKDMLIFNRQEQDDDIESQLLSGDW